jgi:hypothetical protein
LSYHHPKKTIVTEPAVARRRNIFLPKPKMYIIFLFTLHKRKNISGSHQFSFP